MDPNDLTVHYIKHSLPITLSANVFLMYYVFFIWRHLCVAIYLLQYVLFINTLNPIFNPIIKYCIILVCISIIIVIL